jgi:long-chain acyl-CoA synthetase
LGLPAFRLCYSAINTHFTPDEVAYVVDDSEAMALFVDADGEVRISAGGSVRSYEDALANAGDTPPASDGSEMLYSSGTTGKPKAVRRPLPTDGNGSWAQQVLEYALTQRYGMTSESVYLSPAPLYHAAGINYTMAVHRVGAAAILMPRFDAEAVLRLIEKHRVTHAQFVPTMFVRMLKLPDAVRHSYDVSSLKCVIHAAAPCPADVKHRMMEWFGPIIHEYYGGTEGFAGTTIGPRSGWPIRAQWADPSPRCMWWARTGPSWGSASRASCILRADRPSSTSKTRRKQRQYPTTGAGDRWATWVMSTRTATCT